MKLRELAFSDLCISVDCEAFLRGVPGQVGILAPPEEVAPDLIGLHAVLSVAARERAEFSVRYDGVVYRVSSVSSQQGKWWVCRRGMARIPGISELGVAPNLADLMVSLAQDRGLFLVTGLNSQGKSTTAAAMMASWLTTFGDMGVAIESPPEAPLEGPHGEAGWCFQIDADGHELADALALARRWRPKFAYLGEVTTPGMVSQALRAAGSQMAVVTTMYAANVIDAAEGFAKMAEEVEGDNALNMLSDALTMCIHQRLAGDDQRLVMDVLLPTRKPDDPIRAALKNGNFSELEGHIRSTGAKRPAAD
ncbi:MAG: Flp pilus assembly complex ATPase component TadA [Alphaproteobacteria bacterium]|nr:Flp pilus assembly complex ATPase component TadA [Alphaproteobacteria bacterium SS10]